MCLDQEEEMMGQCLSSTNWLPREDFRLDMGHCVNLKTQYSLYKIHEMCVVYSIKGKNGDAGFLFTPKAWNIGNKMQLK